MNRPFYVWGWLLLIPIALFQGASSGFFFVVCTVVGALYFVLRIYHDRNSIQVSPPKTSLTLDQFTNKYSHLPKDLLEVTDAILKNARYNSDDNLFLLDHTLSKLPPLSLAGPSVTVAKLLDTSSVPGLEALFEHRVHIQLPLRTRPQHTHIIGVSGTGKSELIKQLVYQDMQTDASIIVMAPKGNLISDIARIPSDRTTWIYDWNTVGLNLLDLEPALLVWVFETLLETEPTPRQKAFLMLCATQVKNLTELRDYLQRKPPEEFKDVPPSISWRLEPLLKAYPTIERIFSSETNLDILAVMESGKVLLLDTKYLGKTGAALVGRFITALIAKATDQRTSKRLVYVYIDECSVYLTDYIEDMLDRAREARVCLTLAHQRLSQLSPQIEQAVLSVATRLVSRVVPADANKLAPLLKLEPDYLTHRHDFNFILYGQGFLSHPLSLHITPGFLDQFPAPPHVTPIQDAQPYLGKQSTAIEEKDSEEPEKW